MMMEGTGQMLKRLLTMTAIVVALSVSVITPTSAQELDMCPHEPTVEALHLCVAHAEEHGHIDSAGVARSLHAKLDAAGAVLDRGNTAAAVNVLGALMRELDAQAGLHVDVMAADHLRMHAALVIDGLAT
jgi:hypothetical protein